MKISLVIPCYTINKDLEDLAIRAALSYREQVDELIITEDGGFYSPELMKLADLYIWGKDNVGFTKNVNRGWKNAHGDYTMIVNSDTELRRGNLRDLCVPGKVTSPRIVNQNIILLAGPFFVVPKDITIQRGYLREEMRTYSSDSEYENRVHDIFLTVPSVEVYHEQEKTVRAAGIAGGEEQARDREIYSKLQNI